MEWIAGENPAAAVALRDAVARAGALIGAHPLVGRERGKIAEGRYRFFVLTGFTYVIVYDAKRVPPRIVWVLHGARDLVGVLG